MARRRRSFLPSRSATMWMCCFAVRLEAWIPPHPNSTIQWESVHDMRRRLKLEPFNYTTSPAMHPELCRYLTEEECEEADTRMQEHIAAHRSLQVQLRDDNPRKGAINVLVLMIRFTDHVDRELIPKSDFETFFNTKVARWMELNSQGVYTIKPTIIDWITTDNTEKYYAFGKRGIVPEAQKMAWPALDELDNRPDWDWTQFDLDGNGQLDSLVFMHSGYGAETTTTDCFGADFNDRIWAHANSGNRKNAWKSKDGKHLSNGYTIASAFDGDCGTVLAKIGLTAHEYTHTLGTEDLYDGTDPLAAAGVGAFDIMADPYGQAGDADNPGHLSVYSKILIEWLVPTVINGNGIFDLKPAETSPEAFRITLADYGATSEYLLIENRQPLEFDINIWSEGLVIYHIDDAADLQEKLGYPGQPGWPENGNHYQVAVLPKDGKYDLEKGENNGDAGDFWVPGDMLGPGNGGTVYPNTDKYQGGFIEETGIWVKVLSQTGNDVKFEVGGFDGANQATSSSTTAPTAATQKPTAGTPIPTTAAPTKGTPSPTSISPTATTPRPTKAQLSTPQPTATGTTMKPTSPPLTATPAPVPTTFGSYLVTRTPTHKPTPLGYLYSFRPYGVELTQGPTTGPPISGQSPAGTSTPYLSSFGSAEEVHQRTRQENGFLSSAFEELIGSTPMQADDKTDSFATNHKREEYDGSGQTIFVAEGPRLQSDAVAWSTSLFSTFLLLTCQYNLALTI